MTIKDYVLNNSKSSTKNNQIVAVLKHKQKDEYAYIEKPYDIYESERVDTYCVVIFDPPEKGLPISTFENYDVNSLEDELCDYSIDDNNHWLFKSEKKLKNYLESIERKAFNLNLQNNSINLSD